MIRFDRSIAKRILLLDFQQDGIDWVLLRSGLRNVLIEKSGRIACPGSAENGPAIIAALKELTDASDSTGLECLASVSGRGATVRDIAIPFNDKRKIRQILPLELEATLPMPVEGLALDFQMIGEGRDTTAVVLAIPEATITGYRAILQEAGLTPLLLTISGIPAATLLAESPLGKDVSLLIDGDNHHCMLFIIANHHVRFMRSWSPPAEGISDAQALKNTLAQTLEAAAPALPAEALLSAVYLTPRSSRHYALADLSAEAYPATLFALQNASSVAMAGELPGDYGTGALALGLYESLSQKGFNLYRSTFPLKRFLLQYRNHILRSGVLAVILTLLFMVNVYLDINRAEKRAAYFESESASILKSAFPETRKIVNPLQQMIVNLGQMRTYELGSPSGLRVLQTDILAEISKALPQSLDFHVSQFVSSPDRVQLNGTTDTFEAVNQAKELLDKADLFDNVTIVAANMDSNAGRVRFKLAIDLKP